MPLDLKLTPPWSSARRCLILGGCGTALVIVIVLAAKLIMALATMPDTVADCYALWGAADAVVQHLEWFGGSWPKSWEDLEEALQAGGRFSDIYDMRRRVMIDFAADPAQLVKAWPVDDKPPFRVIALHSGKAHHWEGAEPNRLVWEYLRNRAKRPPNYKFPRPPDASEKAARAALRAAGADWKLDSEGRITEASFGPNSASAGDIDANLSHLQTLSALRGLDLGYSGASDKGLKHIEGQTQLRWIYLYGTKVTDAGLAQLGRMSELEMLVLASPNFTDNAMDHIVRHRSLRLLNLNGTQVTDTGIARLREMTCLTEVMLEGTKVTQQGVRALQRALPDCKVYCPDPGAR